MSDHRELGVITYRLLNYINTLDKNDSYYDVTRNILINFNKIENITINDLADLCFVSPATISRFCRHLGFANFQEFKRVCSENFSVENDYSKKLLDSFQENPRSAIENYTKSIIDNINDTLNNIDFDHLDEIAKKIHNAKSVSFFGIQFLHDMGEHLQNKLILMDKFMDAPTTFEEQLECAKKLDSNSIAIITSVEGSYFYRCTEVIDELKRNGVEIIVITQNINSKLANAADKILVCGSSNSNNEGRYTVLYMLEVLIIRYFSLYHHNK